MWRCRVVAAIGALMLCAGVAVVGSTPAASADTPGTVSLGAATIVEGDAGKPRTMQFAVTLTRPATEIVTVGYQISMRGSGATPDANLKDFAPRTGYVTFKPSAKTGKTPTAKWVTAKVTPDLRDEPNEKFSVALNSVTGGDYQLGSATTQANILDDDPRTGLRVSVGDASIWEGDTGAAAKSTNNARVWVNLSAPASETVSVKVSITAGAATQGQDFKTVTGKILTFTSGQYQKAVSVPVYPDLTVEQDETVNITLSDPSIGLELSRSVGKAVILSEEKDLPIEGCFLVIGGYIQFIGPIDTKHNLLVYGPCDDSGGLVYDGSGGFVYTVVDAPDGSQAEKCLSISGVPLGAGGTGGFPIGDGFGLTNSWWVCSDLGPPP